MPAVDSHLIWATIFVALVGWGCSSSDGGGGSTSPDARADAPRDTGPTALDVAVPDAKIDRPDAVPTWPGLDAPWAAATTPFDRSCITGCEEIAVRTLDHVGLQVRVLTNAAADDPISQWSDCVQSMMRCIDAGGAPAQCGSESACPVACRRELARLAAQQNVDPTDEGSLLDLFEALFIESGGPCGPGSAARAREGGLP